MLSDSASESAPKIRAEPVRRRPVRKSATANVMGSGLFLRLRGGESDVRGVTGSRKITPLPVPPGRCTRHSADSRRVRGGGHWIVRPEGPRWSGTVLLLLRPLCHDVITRPVPSGRSPLTHLAYCRRRGGRGRLHGEAGGVPWSAVVKTPPLPSASGLTLFHGVPSLAPEREGRSRRARDPLVAARRLASGGRRYSTNVLFEIESD